MRKIAAFLLTGIVCFNLFGFYALFILKQAEIKEEMSESIGVHQHLGECETLLLNHKEFVALDFLDHDKEVRIHGMLYDVVSIERLGMKMQVVLEFDKKETSLINAFTELWGQQQAADRNSSPLKTVISHIQQDYVAGQLFCFIMPAEPQLVRTAAQQIFNASSYIAGNHTPPPQFFLV